MISNTCTVQLSASRNNTLAVNSESIRLGAVSIVHSQAVMATEMVLESCMCGWQANQLKLYAFK